MSLPPNYLSRSACTIDGSPKILNWEVSRMDIIRPHRKKMINFTKLGHDIFASTDGSVITIWTPTKIIANINVPALSLVYIPELTQIVSFSSKSTQLHFVKNKNPYKVTVHPKLFSNKVISHMIYFEKERILVCSGQGIMITKIVIPHYVAGIIPQVESLVFEKIAEIYTDEVFSSMRRPVAVPDLGIFLVWFGKSIFVHDLEGNKVKEIHNMAHSFISNCSFLSHPNTLCISEESGSVSILRYKSVQSNVPSVFHVSDTSILCSVMISNDFFVSVSLNKLLSVYSISAMKSVLSIQLNNVPQKVFIADNFLLILSGLAMEAFRLNLFTESFTSTMTNAVSIERLFTTDSSPKLATFQENGTCFLIDSIDGTRLLGIEPNDFKNSIEHYLFNTNVLIDGENFIRTNVNNHIAFVFKDYNCYVTEFSQKRSIPMKNIMNALFRFNIKDYTGDMFQMTSNKIMTTLRTGGSEIITIEQTGHIHFYDTVLNKETGVIFCSLSNFITAVTCFSMRLVIMASYEKLQILDLQKKKIVSEVETPSFTSLKMLDNDTVICGCVDGHIENRSVPQLDIQDQSPIINGVFIKKSDINNLKELPSSISTLDYSRTRMCILSLTNNNILTLHNYKCEIVARISFPFKVYAACFLDGYGSIVISAFERLLKVNADSLYLEKLKPVKTQLDEFGMKKKDVIKTKAQKCLVNEITQEEIANFNKKYLMKKERAAPEPKKVIIKKEVEVFQPVNEFEDLVVEDDIQMEYFVESRKWDYSNVELKLRQLQNVEKVAEEVEEGIHYLTKEEKEERFRKNAERNKKRFRKAAKKKKAKKSPKKKEVVKEAKEAKKEPKEPKKTFKEVKKQKSPKPKKEIKAKKSPEKVPKGPRELREPREPVDYSREYNFRTKRNSLVNQPSTPVRQSVRAKISQNKKVPYQDKAFELQPVEKYVRPTSFKPFGFPTDSESDEESKPEILFQIKEPTLKNKSNSSFSDDSMVSSQSAKFIEPGEYPSIGEVTEEEFEEYLKTSSSVIFDDSSQTDSLNGSRRSSRRSSRMKPRKLAADNDFFNTSSTTLVEDDGEDFLFENPNMEQIKSMVRSPQPNRKKIVVKKVRKEYPPYKPPPKAPLLRIKNFGPCEKVKLPPENHLLDDRTKRVMRIIETRNPQLKIKVNDSVSSIMKKIKEEAHKIK